MLAISIHSTAALASNIRFYVIGLLTLLALGACSQKQSFSDAQRCEPYQGLQPLCDFQAPEDLALLPDQSGIIVSEFGQMGDIEGKISLLNLDTMEKRVLYDAASSNDLKSPNAIWGGTECTEAAQFSPHGIDLAQRPSGRWQLLVVNHGGRESVEFFELKKDLNNQWQLQWAGCVEADDDSLYNDIAATQDGFVVSRMMSRDAGAFGMLDYFFGKVTGQLLRWSLADGFSGVAQSESVMANGVVYARDSGLAFVNAYGEDKLKVMDVEQQVLVKSIPMVSADNSNWDVTHPGKILVASHDFKLLDMIGCMSEGSSNCPSEFEIIEVDSESLATKVLFKTDGNYFGAGTAAVRLGDQLFIGSFTGQRLLIAPVGYGVVDASAAKK